MKYPQLVSMPSDVSDWLEEQLEARGIDAVVYTRYVLSLLYKDPADVICPDQDFQVAYSNKDTKRTTSGGRKRIRRSSDWWGNTHIDADELKRTAAVECLMSAADQKCGIESLVDELCAKLKEAKENSTTPTQEAPSKSAQENHKLSPQDQAKQYYAAFPALSRNSTSPLITLIPKWLGSPKKKAKKEQTASSDEKTYLKSDADKKPKKPSHFGRYKKEVGYRNTAKSVKRSESMADWNLYMFNDKMKSAECNTIWSEKLGMIPAYSLDMKENESNKKWSWNDYENNLNMYNNLPLELRDLLNSPVPQDVSKKEVTLPNDHETTANKRYSWFNSIWSMDVAHDYSENSFDAIRDGSRNTENLGVELSTLSLTPSSAWPLQEAVCENEKNVSAERQQDLFRAADMAFKDIELGSIPWHMSTILEKWSDPDGQDEEAELVQVNRSLGKLSSTKGNSAFAEVYPRSKLYSMFCKNSNSTQYCKEDPIPKDLDDKEDLLTSEKTHFRPISEKSDETNLGKYIDGTTFVIPSNLEKVEYKTTEHGNFFLDDENGVQCNYREYKTKYIKSSFIPKYKVIQNDKACQTDFDFYAVETNVGVEAEPTKNEDTTSDNQKIVDDILNYYADNIWKPNDLATKTDFSSGELLTRPDSVAAELFETYEDACDKCSKNKQSWNAKMKDTKVADDNNIWNGEICRDCLKKNENKPPLSQEQNQFRQDITRDGEQLLSDLNCWQKTYIEGMGSEIPYQISELFRANDIKRRHSSTVNYYGCILLMDDFSFASQLEHAKLSSVIPSLRSVTL